MTVLLLSLGLSGCSGVYFYPMQSWVQNPARLGLAYEDIVLINPSGLRLHGWWLPAAGPARGTVYFLHGNAQNISTHIMSVSWLPDAGFNVFLIDYRGYGLSEGKPRLPETLADIQLGLDWLRGSGRLGQGPLIVLGQSLGASMAVPVLAQEENQAAVRCAVLEAGFTGFRTIVNDVMKQSWLLWPMRPLMLPWLPDERLDPINNIGDIGFPVLVMHSRDDQIIPFAHGKALYRAATAPKEFQALRGGHNAALQDPAVQRRVMEFMSGACGAAAVEPEQPQLVPGVPGTPSDGLKF